MTKCCKTKEILQKPYSDSTTDSKQRERNDHEKNMQYAYTQN